MTLYQQHGATLTGGLLIFGRTLAFLFLAPLFNRSDIPFNIKLSFAVFLTIALLWLVPLAPNNQQISFLNGNMGLFLLALLMNMVVGALIGFIADLILKTVASAGSLMNNQIGLSSAVIFDPSSRSQVMVLDRLFAFIGLLVFMNMGGIFWMLQALKRSFEVFPLFNIYQPIATTINLDYLVLLSANTVVMATVFVAPVIVVTMAMDMILGIVNRTAQQMPVFQLSFALKPCIGIAIMLTTMPIFLKALSDYLEDFSRIF